MRKKYADEVSEYRVRRAKAATALIVVIDADAHTVQDRFLQLDQALKNRRIRSLNLEHEQIARLVPKRNVETWILCLNDHQVDEDADYKNTRNDWHDLIPQAAGTLSEWTHRKTEPPSHCIDSLRSGVKELNGLRI